MLISNLKMTIISILKKNYAKPQRVELVARKCAVKLSFDGKGAEE